jgi:hypothetical protein
MSYITSNPFALGSLITLMMEAAHTSETSVDIQLTRQYIPEDSELELKPLKTIVFVHTYFQPMLGPSSVTIGTKKRLICVHVQNLKKVKINN